MLALLSVILTNDPEKQFHVAFSLTIFSTINFGRQVKCPNLINLPVNIRVIILCISFFDSACYIVGKKFGKNKGPKYVREPWMLRGGRALENTMEVEVENDQGGN